VAPPPPADLVSNGQLDGTAPGAVPSAVHRWIVVLGVVAVLAVAAYARFEGLGHPDRIYFDETYYVEDARSYLERGVEEVRPAHPPLGKWVIAAGIAIVGDHPVGWRSANALLGVATVAATMAAGRLLVRRWWPALLAGLLVSLDGLAVVSSRIGMLDASLAWWIAAAFLALVVDHRRQDPARTWPSPWRLASGLLLGLAVATKWSGLLAIPAAFALAALSDASMVRARWRGADAAGTDVVRTGWFLVLRLALPFAIVPAAAYVAAYVPWMAAYAETQTAGERCDAGHCGPDVDDRLAGWWHEQRELVAFHDRLQATHPNRSHAWQWPLLDEPVLMYLERCRADATACPYEPGERRTILGLGSPALWWPALLAVPVLGVVAVRRRWWAGAAVVAFAVGQWAPWLLSPKPGFSFYLIPVVPFVALAVALAAAALPARRARLLAIGLVVVAVAAFVFWRPFHVGSVLDEGAIDRRAWLPSWD
jgi:dolichyl-phosphate-mannose-protein mannosyltransferase